MIPFRLTEKWSEKYKRTIDCKNPKGFSQRAHCQGRETNEETETENSGLLEKLTGAAFERSVVNTGNISKTGSGAQTPDIKIKSKRSKKYFDGEAKAGNHIDYFQSTVTGKVKTRKGKVTGIGLNRPTGKTAKKLGRATARATGYVAKHARRRMKGATYSRSATHRGKSVSPVGKAFSGSKKEVKKKITNKSLHAMLHAGGDPVHIHHNTTTGEIAVVPVSNSHKRHTNAMGLKGQPSIEQIANHPNERRSSLGGQMRLRRKERRANASLQGDSHKIIDAVKRHGGKVFKDHDEFHAHMRKHGVQISTGHAR